MRRVYDSYGLPNGKRSFGTLHKHQKTIGNFILYGSGRWYDMVFYSTLFLLGLSGGNAAGYLAGLQGGSDGAYVLKTVSAVQLPYAYSQLKRLIFGRWVFDATSEGEFKADLGIITGLSIVGGLGTFTLTYKDHSITAGDALFMA